MKNFEKTVIKYTKQGGTLQFSLEILNVIKNIRL